MAGHIATAKRDDWCSPECIVSRVHRVFGGRPDLDPCSNARSIVGAKRTIALPENGLAAEWRGSVYVNPPYGRGIEEWIEKASRTRESGPTGEAILLIPAAVSAHYFHDFVLDRADALCCVRGRLQFLGAPTTAPFASAVVYYGWNPDAFVSVFSEIGWTVRLPGVSSSADRRKQWGS